jgi:hypothetical protein
MASVRIKQAGINSNNWVTVYCGAVIVNATKNLTTEPNATGTSIIEVQTESAANPTFTLRDVVVDNTVAGLASSTLTYNQLQYLYRTKYDGTNPIYLEITVGTSTVITGYDGATSPIPTVMANYAYPFDVSDSRNAKLSSFNLTLIETA